MKLPVAPEMRMYLAVFVSAYGAIFGSGWIIGFDKYLYNQILPPGQRTSYISVVHAWSGLAAGAGPLLAGWFVAFCGGLDTTVMGVHLDPYMPLFGVYLLILAAGVFYIGRLQPDTGVSATQLAWMFLQPGQLAAMSTVFRYRFAKTETDRVEKTRQMGLSSNPLNVEELIESLNDPSFNVRYEAVITIASRRPNPQLTGALIDILLDPDPELASSAAWALGRIGDATAIPALREALAIPYPLLQARAARALGTLNDMDSAPMLLSWLRIDSEPPLKRACAAALGALQYLPALPDIVGLLVVTKRSSFRGELATAAARIMGAEQEYVKLLREGRTDLSTTAGGALLDLKKILIKKKPVDRELVKTAEIAARYFAKGDFTPALATLQQVIHGLEAQVKEPGILDVLKVFCHEFAVTDTPDVEVISLSLHVCRSVIKTKSADS
jgi:hypothetical protein